MAILDLLKTSKTTSEEKAAQAAQAQAEKLYQQGVATIRDLIAPAALEINFTHLKLGGYFVRTLFTYTYPRYIYTNWLSPVINFDNTMEISMYIYPVESQAVLNNLRKRVAQMET